MGSLHVQGFSIRVSIVLMRIGNDESRIRISVRVSTWTCVKNGEARTRNLTRRSFLRGWRTQGGGGIRAAASARNLSLVHHTLRRCCLLAGTFQRPAHEAAGVGRLLMPLRADPRCGRGPELTLPHRFRCPGMMPSSVSRACPSSWLR